MPGQGRHRKKRSVPEKIPCLPTKNVGDYVPAIQAIPFWCMCLDLFLLPNLGAHLVAVCHQCSMVIQIYKIRSEIWHPKNQHFSAIWATLHIKKPAIANYNHFHTCTPAAF